MVVEPSGAVVIAAILEGKFGELQGRQVIGVVSGGNISVNDLYEVYS